MRRLLLLMLLLPAAAHAGDITFYRCTDASGALTIQNMPCPKGMQQTTKVMQAVAAPPPMLAPLPALPAPPAAPAALAAQTAPTTPVAPLPVEKPTPVALPALFLCKGRGIDDYLSETADPPSRCVPMRVVGLDGNPAKGAGEACEVQRDTCTAVDPTQLCSTWQQRVHDAEAAARFTSLAQPDAPARYQRLQALWDASDCAAQKP